MELRETLSRRLKEIKEERGLSVVEFSQLIGISRSALQAILSRRANPRADTIEQIAERLHVNPISLLVEPSDLHREGWLLNQVTEQVLEKVKEMMDERHK